MEPYLTLFYAAPSDVDNFCLISKRHAQICAQANFWENKMAADFPTLYSANDLNTFHPRDLYRIYRFVDKRISANVPDTRKYIIQSALEQVKQYPGTTQLILIWMIINETEFTLNYLKNHGVIEKNLFKKDFELLFDYILAYSEDDKMLYPLILPARKWLLPLIYKYYSATADSTGSDAAELVLNYAKLDGNLVQFMINNQPNLDPSVYALVLVDLLAKHPTNKQLLLAFKIIRDNIGEDSLYNELINNGTDEGLVRDILNRIS